jgi:DNA replication and repair protein RecF
VARLLPHLADAYQRVAESRSAAAATVAMSYEAAWAGGDGASGGAPVGLGPALARARRDDLRRGVSTVGPHRDELSLSIGGLPARTHASQGEQRSLALALRLAAHLLVAEAAGSAPVLLLDDVFSELDPQRSDALLRALPPGQILLSTAGVLPAGARPDLVLDVHDGTVRPRAPAP